MNHLETQEPTMNHIENPMTNMKHHEPLMTTPRNSMNQKDPPSFSNRFAHADPRDLHRPQLQPSGKSPSRLLSYGIHLARIRLSRKAEENGGKEEERDYMPRPLTERRKEKYPSDGSRERTREGDFHLSSTRLTGLRCVHRDGVSRAGRSKRE